MDNRLFSLFLTAVLSSVLWASSASAADKSVVIDPNIDRRDIDESYIDVDDFEVGIFAGVMNIEDFGNNSLLGLSLSYHINENFFAQVHYGTSTAGETSFETLSGGAQLLTDDQRDFTYYDVSIGYNINGESFVTDQITLNSSLYLMLGAGNAEFGGDERFKVNVGAGYRLILSDYAVVNIDMTDHIFDNDILGTQKTTHNLAFSIGASIFF